MAEEEERMAAEQVEGPQFEHDCDACEFIGRGHHVEGVPVDVYFCAQGGAANTIVLRASSDGADYESGATSWRQIAELSLRDEARSRVGRAYDA